MQSNNNHVLTPFFEPGGVAAIGSMKEGRGEGYRIVEYMLRFGFSGKVYPISRSVEQVLGRRAYPTIED
ncbi:MAG: hypothetical protein NTU41_08255, partial [Chloroflexi bacterium]|nr:hypothetical protein [Chloroflexota bacterium]